MDNYASFKSLKSKFSTSIQNKPTRKKEFDLAYGLVFINTEDRMNDFIDK